MAPPRPTSRSGPTTDVPSCCHPADGTVPAMRTTVTLDSDAEQLLRRQMRERGVSFTVALDDAIREALGGAAPGAFRTRIHDLGIPTVNLDRALAIAGDLEDETRLRTVRRS